MTLRLLRIAPLLMLLSGCLLNTQDVRVTAEHKTQIERVGVVSLLPPDANVSVLGSSALESDFGHAAIDGWDPERIVAAVLLPRFERQGFTARMLPAHGALAQARASDWRAPLADSIAEAAYAAGAEAGVDMIVVVQPQVGEDFVTDTNQNVRGYGIQRAFDTAPFVYAAVVVEAFDVDRRFVVGRAEGRQKAPAADAAWNADFDAISGTVTATGTTGAALGEQLESLLRISIGIAAQEAGL
jgi:hypothetical protein